MLKTLSRLHTPDLLHTLASMGHGDEIVVVDAHFPAVSLARRLVRLDAAGVPEVVEAVVALMPLDSFVPDPALRMEVAGRPDEIPAVQAECQTIIDRAERRPTKLVGVERHAFYARAREAFAIVVTGEQRPYGCLMLKKGVTVPVP